MSSTVKKVAYWVAIIAGCIFIFNAVKGYIPTTTPSDDTGSVAAITATV